jgi:hypothetical protein
LAPIRQRLWRKHGIFKRHFAETIQKGRGIKIAGDTRPCMIADLSKAFVHPLWKYRTDLYARL